jgi:hypothetical protein
MELEAKERAAKATVRAEKRAKIRKEMEDEARFQRDELYN